MSARSAKTRQRQLVEICPALASWHRYLQAPAARQLCKTLDQQIEQCDAAIATLIAQDAELAHKVKRLDAIPGGDPVVAATMLAERPAHRAHAPNKPPPPPWRGRTLQPRSVMTRAACAMMQAAAGDTRN